MTWAEFKKLYHFFQTNLSKLTKQKVQQFLSWLINVQRDAEFNYQIVYKDVDVTINVIFYPLKTQIKISMVT
jgi:hypothetical protein